MQRGFTLIELIIVIVILGILAVTAAPRFIDISDEANLAATKSEAANFKTSIQLIYAAYQIKKESPLVIDSQSYPIDSVSGWPTGSGAGAQFCVNLWNNVLDSSETVIGTSNPTVTLADGWNAFGDQNFCAYLKTTGDRTFIGGSLPHFVYYIRDVSAFSFNGQTYQGEAGDIQLINF